MKKFDFRLEKILDYRDACKKVSRAELAERNNALFSIEKYVQELEEEQARIANREQEEFDLSEMFLSALYQDKLKNDLEQQKILEEQAKIEVEKARDIFIEKSKEVRVMELLKDKQREIHRLDAKRKERKELDEIAHRRC